MTIIKSHLFVLPNILLNPGGKVTLNIFEPRYQALVDDCITNKVPMSLGTAFTDRNDDDLIRIPHEKFLYVTPIVGFGQVRHLHTADNGHKLVLIHGQMKGKILDIYSEGTQYLSAEIEVIDEQLELSSMNKFLFRRLHALIEDKVKPMLTETRDRKVLLDSLVHPSEVIAFYSENILNSLEAKLHLLRLNDINDKISFLSELVLKAPEDNVSHLA
ncbi:MAG: hypothetical protein CO099_11540 [Bdellovibrio sp. CG_4_9_14_3_um_filter_39_7]|nr:MAG: hypothetical protein CO099_11540 [Bdellovibrio sp. CG_4_9_14_3_um_filter_39_7]